MLTTVGDISEEKWDERFEWMAKRGDEYFLLVIVDGEGKIVGTGALIVERKLLVAFFSILLSLRLFSAVVVGGWWWGVRRGRMLISGVAAFIILA